MNFSQNSRLNVANNKETIDMETAKFNTTAFAWACGSVWAISVFFLGLMSWLLGWGHAFTNLLGSVYLGYSGTLVGTLIGTAWAFVDAFIGGFIFAWIYNYFCQRQS